MNGVAEDGRRYAEHTDGTRTYVCTGTVPPKWGTATWPCIRAEGHDGDCKPSAEHADYAAPFETFDRDWLLSELHRTYFQAKRAHQDLLDAHRRQEEEQRLTAAVLHDVLSNGGGRTAATHDPGCYRKHPRCLARLLIAGDQHALTDALTATAQEKP